MKNLKQLAALMMIVLLLINLVVFALKLISALLFWGVIIVAGFIAFKGMKRLK